MRKFIKKLWEGIKALYLALRPETKHAIIVSIEITSRLNDFIHSPTADVLTAVIPGTVDDRMKDKLRVIIPSVLKQLKLAESALEDPEEIVKSAIDELQKLHGDAKRGFLHIIASMIVRHLSSIKWSDTVAVVEYKYSS